MFEILLDGKVVMEKMSIEQADNAMEAFCTSPHYKKVPTLKVALAGTPGMAVKIVMVETFQGLTLEVQEVE